MLQQRLAELISIVLRLIDPLVCTGADVIRKTLLITRLAEEAFGILVRVTGAFIDDVGLVNGLAVVDLY